VLTRFSRDQQHKLARALRLTPDAADQSASDAHTVYAAIARPTSRAQVVNPVTALDAAWARSQRFREGLAVVDRPRYACSAVRCGHVREQANDKHNWIKAEFFCQRDNVLDGGGLPNRGLIGGHEPRRVS
jgi:hypothetical protein